MNYYLCSGNRTGIVDPENWIFCDLSDGCDVMKIEKLENPRLVFATPECNSFTDLPWRPATNSGLPLLKHCLELCKQSPYWLLENSRFAQRFIGKADYHRDSHFFWGNVVFPVFHKKKSSISGKYPLKRAALPNLLDSRAFWSGSK